MLDFYFCTRGCRRLVRAELPARERQQLYQNTPVLTRVCYTVDMTEQADIHKAGGVLIKDRCFLVTRAYGKDVFVAPGGKLESGETAIAALIREMTEEVQVKISPTDLEPIGTFYARAAGNESQMLEMDVFLIKSSQGEPSPSSEIEEIMWVNTQTTGIKLGSIFEHDVMPRLKAMDLID